MRVLFLTPWYPSDKDAMSGLFVHKHVEAVRAQGADVRVIFSQGWRDTWRQWKALQREGWMPNVVQLNVIQKQGLLALWLKKRHHIPYIIIEHWTGYLPENSSIQPHSLHTRFMKTVCANAEVVMPVSEQLGGAMRALGFQAQKWQKINNVVDDFFFRSPIPHPPSPIKRLLNITCFDEPHKNVKGLLRAMKRLRDKRQDWHLVLVGTGPDYAEVRAYAESLRFDEGQLEWTGELTPEQVAAQFDQADFMVLSSHYENAPVVISESLAKGVPVVSTNVGGIAEMVNKQSGILVPPRDESALEHAIEEMMDHCRNYDPAVIRSFGLPYSFANVGQQLIAVYEQVCAR